MPTISNNLEELNGKRGELPMNAEQLLTKLGFEVVTRDTITYQVHLPEGWTQENYGQFHEVFRGPLGEEVWSFIKHDPWDRHSYLEASNINI